MVPAQIILLPHLPLTPNGKVDRHRLSLTDRPPVAPMSSSAVTGPHADQLARLVRQSCRIDIPAMDSNFLDLGLTSIDMIRIVNAIDAELGFRPGIEKLYAAPTIEWIAGHYAEWLGGREPDRMAPRHDLTKPGTRAIDSAAPPFVLSAKAMPTALADLLRQRRSIRQFALRPIDADHLGSLLAAAMPQDGRYPYGSASSLYPVQTWLHAKAGRITGLAPGAHHYDPEAHILRPLDSDGRLNRSAFSPHNAPVIDEAAFILFLVADMEAIEPVYGDRAEHLATLEAGLMTQLFELAAQACGLGLCQIGSADNEAVRVLLGLSDRHRLLHMIVGGYPDESPQATMPPDTTEEGRLARLFQRIERLSPEEVRALLDACSGGVG
jgi:SagB-type dehydrogenase family enzyme